jgi:hypothetical protein
MPYYYKISQSVADQTALVTLLRGFFTHASLGWTESAYTAGLSNELLLKTKDSHLTNYGILHLIINVAGATKYLEVHAYPPGYAAFTGGYTFDAPNPSYLPGGGSYNEANEYYNSTGSCEHRIDFAFPATVDLFGDGDTGLIYVTGGTYKWTWFGLLLTRTLGHGWVQFSTGTIAKGSIKNGANIRKSTSYFNFFGPNYTNYWGGIATSLNGFAQDTTPSKWLMQAYGVDIEAAYKEILAFPSLFYSQDDASRGDEQTYGGKTYYIVVPGSETNHSLAVAVEKGTAIP